MTISFVNIYNTGRKKFNDDIATGESVQTQYENDKNFTLDESSLGSHNCWCYFVILPGKTEKVENTSGGAGTGNFRTPGEMIAMVFGKLGIGDGNILALCDLIKTSFRSITITGVTFRTPWIERVGRSKDNKWWHYNVHLPFYSDDIITS